MDVGELKTLSQRIEKLDAALVEAQGTGFLHENYDDGFTVTWEFENVASPQQIRERVETLAVWLWSLKDYLKARLKATGGSPSDVENYVNGCRYLPLCADIANRAKHGKLNNSRSGQFAHISETVMEVHSSLSVRALENSPADVALNVEDPEKVKYNVKVRDKNDKYVGDAFVILSNSWREWTRFMRRHKALRAAIP